MSRAESTGIWIQASYINHDCIGNATRAFIGDMMIIRATKDIPKDTEIFMRYKVSDGDHAEMQQSLRHWKFDCFCPVCVAESATPTHLHGRRVKALREEKMLRENNPLRNTSPNANLVARAERLLAEIESTYDERLFNGLPRAGLIDLSLWVCMAYTFSYDNRKVLSKALAVMRNAGFLVTIARGRVAIDRSHGCSENAVIDAAMYAAGSHYNQGQMGLGKQFEAFAKEQYQIMHGRMGGFKERYGTS